MWKSLLTMFAGPLGNLISSGLAAGGAAFVSWQVSKGIPIDAAANIAGGLVTALSTGISVLAGTQGIKISAVNAADNGVKVVPAAASAPTVNGPLK